MSIDEDFFKENLVSINSLVTIILFVTMVVPLSFILMTLIGLWRVQHWYSVLTICYSFVCGLINLLLNKNPRTQKLCMYFGMSALSGFVFLLGCNNLIYITLTFCCIPFLSCIYYNRRFTNIISLLNLVSIGFIYLIRGHSADGESLRHYFLSHFVGILVEYIFVFLIANFLSYRIRKTLTKMANIAEERDSAYINLKEKNKEISAINHQLNETQFKIIEFVAKVLGSHDLFTGFHVLHTRKYVEIIARQLRENGFYTDILTDENIELYSSAAFLHDIGKVHIPEGILNKVGRFTSEEFEVMKSHPGEGLKLLKFLPEINGGEFNRIAEQMCYCHHEKFDGSGYPCGLKGTEIPLCARIMTAADVMDALISQRLYKSPMTIDAAIEIFEESKGSHFEECIVDAVIAARDQIEAADRQFKATETQMNAEELQWWINYHQRFNPEEK